MNTFMGILAFVVVLLVGVNGRHIDNNDYEDVPEQEHTDLFNRMRDSPSQMRHRHRARRYPYEYQPPFYYPDYRRDYNPQQEDLSRILKALDEIISNMRRAPPPPPQPQPQVIYIPYPVVQCQSSGGAPNVRPNNSIPLPPIDVSKIPEFGSKSLIDSARNWGLITEDVIDNTSDEGDGSRPISLKPVQLNRPIKPAPPVDHGTQQGGAPEQTTKAPTPIPKPGRCEIAILACCSEESEQKKTCFQRFGCMATFSTRKACHPNVIQVILSHYNKAYGPSGDE